MEGEYACVSERKDNPPVVIGGDDRERGDTQGTMKDRENILVRSKTEEGHKTTKRQ